MHTASNLHSANLLTAGKACRKALYSISYLCALYLIVVNMVYSDGAPCNSGAAEIVHC